LRDFWKGLRENRLAVVGGIIILVLFLLALLAPWISPYDPSRIDPRASYPSLG